MSEQLGAEVVELVTPDACPGAGRSEMQTQAWLYFLRQFGSGPSSAIKRGALAELRPPRGAGAATLPQNSRLESGYRGPHVRRRRPLPRRSAVRLINGRGLRCRRAAAPRGLKVTPHAGLGLGLPSARRGNALHFRRFVKAIAGVFLLSGRDLFRPARRTPSRLRAARARLPALRGPPGRSLGEAGGAAGALARRGDV